MTEEEFKKCSVVAYPHEIRFLSINGGRVNFYVDRRVSDYVNKLQQENEQLEDKLRNTKYKLLQKNLIINKAKEHISKNTNKAMSEEDFISMLLEILDNKGE